MEGFWGAFALEPQNLDLLEPGPALFLQVG